MRTKKIGKEEINYNGETVESEAWLVSLSMCNSYIVREINGVFHVAQETTHSLEHAEFLIEQNHKRWEAEALEELENMG